MLCYGLTSLILNSGLSSYAQAQAQAVNPIGSVALLNRCYAFLTGFPISLNDDRYKKVQAGSLNPLDVCDSILDRAVSDSKNRAIMNFFSNPNQYRESQRVIQNFYDVHRAWFDSLTPMMSTHLTPEVFDFSEPALTLNHHLFQELPYRQMLSGTESYRAERRYERSEIPLLRNYENGQFGYGSDTIVSNAPEALRASAAQIKPTVMFSKLAVRSNDAGSVQLNTWIAQYNHGQVSFAFYDPYSNEPHHKRFRTQGYDISNRRVTVGDLVTTELDNRSFITPTSVSTGATRLPQCGNSEITLSNDAPWSKTTPEIRSRCVRGGGAKSFCNDRDAANAPGCERYCVERHIQCQKLCSMTDGGNLDGACNIKCRADTADHCSYGDGRQSRWGEDAHNGLEENIDISKSFGGGLIGAQSFLLTTSGMYPGYKSNGESRTQRRWSNNLLNKLACQTLPTLRMADVIDKVRSGGVSYRSSATCVACHATMDPLANVIRNLSLNNSSYFIDDNSFPSNTRFRSLEFIGRYSTTKAITPDSCRRATEADKSKWRSERNCKALLECGEKLTWPESWCHQPVDNFHRQDTTGRLFFRSYTGELVDRELNNLEDAGVALAATDDYYTCAAKNYFYYFTGNTVPLYDMGNPANSNLNKAMTQELMAQRNFVHSLGQAFKGHQSQKQLIKDIMRSPYFQSNDFKVEGAK
jgi:hypothetical protein